MIMKLSTAKNFHVILYDFLKIYPFEKRTFLVFLGLRRHDFLNGSLYFSESLLGFPIPTK